MFRAQIIGLALAGVIAPGLVSHALAQPLDQAPTRSADKTTSQYYEVAPLQELGTSLQFKRTPSQLQADVMSGKAPPNVKLAARPPITFEQFVQLYINMSKARRGSSFIGVVVDTSDPNWKEGHIRDVQSLAQYLIAGAPENSKPGLALTDGASITGVIPITYDTTDRAKKFVDAADMANDEMEGVTVEIGEVLIAINNHVLPRSEKGHFLTELEDVYYAILDAAILGRFGYDMREHANAYSVHVDRAALEQEKRAAIQAWDYNDTPFSSK